MRQTMAVLRIMGYADVEIYGGNIEQLLNLLAKRQFRFWDVRRGEGNTAFFGIVLRDFFRLRPLLKETGCRIHVAGRHGLPFLLDKLGKRKFFAAGFVLFVAVVYTGSLLVWHVQVIGNEKIATQEILAKAKNLGIYQFQWNFRLGDLDLAAKKMAAQLPNAAWVGIETRGTRVLIKVVEANKPEKRPLLSPRNLVADADAVVTKIQVEQGKPVVKTNMRVKKGQILVSGLVGEGEFTHSVVAKGTVRGLVWRQYRIAVPLVQRKKVYTGVSASRNYLVFGNWALKISGFGKLNFAQYETMNVLKKPQWRGKSLPFGFLRQTLREVRTEVATLSIQKARQIGIAQAKWEIERTKGADATVKSEKILQERSEGGKVVLEVLFEVDEDIAMEQPIVQGE